MKLIKQSGVSNSTIEVRNTSGLDRALLRVFPNARTKNRGTQSYSGRTTWGRCHVQYDFLLPGGDFPIVSNKQDVVFGHQLYQGLMPVRHLGANVYECSVDVVTEVIIGTIE